MGVALWSALIHPNWAKVRAVLTAEGLTNLPEDNKALAVLPETYKALEVRIAKQLEELASFEKRQEVLYLGGAYVDRQWYADE